MKVALPCLVALVGCGHPAGPAGPVGNTGPAAPGASASRCPQPTAAIAHLVDTLDADADILHLDYTPAVHALIDEGIAGACAVVDRLGAESEETRMHAQRVLEGVLAAQLGFVPGRGFRDEYGEETTRRLATEIGYDYDAALDVRRAAAVRWRHWLAAGPTVAAYDGPPPDEMKAALDAVGPQLHRCGEPVDLTVTFDRTGRVASIWGSASTGATYHQCLTTAAATVTVKPFLRDSVWTRYPW